MEGRRDREEKVSQRMRSKIGRRGNGSDSRGE